MDSTDIHNKYYEKAKLGGENKEMLKIEFLNGGLANQAFQYIFARHYELSHPGEIMYMDDSYFALNTVHNGYELENVFGIKPHMLSEAFDADVWEYMLSMKKAGTSIPQILKDSGIDMDIVIEYESGQETYHSFDGNIYVGKTQIYDPQVQEFERDTYFHGYWLNCGWFKKFRKQFLEEFTFPELTDDYNKRLLDRILNEKSVSIHIRRGDYVDRNAAYKPEVYEKMVNAYMEHCDGNAVLYVFSDDIMWCRKNRESMALDQVRDVVFVDKNTGANSYIDMQLMSNCEDMIVGNSAFVFLAALLNRRKRAVINFSDREI